MYYRINEVSTIARTGNTYVHVDYWRRKAHFDAAQPPFLTNDFHMHLRPDQQDVRQLVLDAIVNYWRRMRKLGFSGDHTGDATKPLKKNGQVVAQDPTVRPPTRDDSDPHDVLSRPDIVSLRNHKKEERDL